MKSLPVLLAAATLLLSACQPSYEKRIAEMEKQLSDKYTAKAADSLLVLLKAAVKASPDNHAQNMAYLTRGAEILFFKKDDATSAVR